MKMRVTGRCSVRGKHCEPGTILDLPSRDALDLLACGRGEALNPAEIEAAVREENNAIAAETRAAETRRFRVVR